MQSSLVVRMTENRQAQGWLHRAAGTPDTLILLLHGHNSNGGRSRFITLAKWFEHHHIDCIRWNVVRESLGDNKFRVPTVSEEYDQVKALAQSIRHKYKRIVAIGHSQGAMLALKLCTEGLADAYVSIMGVGDTHTSMERKLARIGLTDEALRGQSLAALPEWMVTQPDGVSYVYAPTFLVDFTAWDMASLFAQLRVPSLFIAGTRDDTIPVSEVEGAYAIVHDRKKLLTVDDVHRFSDETAMMLAGVIVNWLREE